jgi:hypothetical protein
VTGAPPRAEVVGALLRSERLRRVDEGRQERKLRLVVEVAERAWAG